MHHKKPYIAFFFFFLSDIQTPAEMKYVHAPCCARSRKSQKPPSDVCQCTTIQFESNSMFKIMMLKPTIRTSYNSFLLVFWTFVFTSTLFEFLCITYISLNKTVSHQNKK